MILSYIRSMANTYTQIHIQAVFAVQNRLCLINKQWKDQLYKYITGVIQNQGHKLLAINGVADHVHIFFGYRPVQSLSDLMQDVKGNSSKWINQNRLVKGRFSWQEGYGAFSYHKNRVQSIINYILRQEEHHKKISFRHEYQKLLEEFEVEYDQNYIFKDI